MLKSPLLIGLLLLGVTPLWARPAYHVERDHQTVTIMLSDHVTPLSLSAQPPWLTITPGSWSGQLTKQAEAPELPVLEYLISIPAGAVVKDIQVEGTPISRNLSAPLKPVRRDYIPRPGVSPPALVAAPGLYHQTQLYPSHWVDQETTRMGSTTVLRLLVYPYKYQGTTLQLIRYDQLKLTITLQSSGWSPSPTPINQVDRVIRQKLVNPEQAFFGQGVH